MYWRSECRNRYSTDRLDATESMAAAAAVVVVAEPVAVDAAAAAVAIAVVSARWINAKLNTQNEMNQSVFYFPACTHTHNRY